MGEHVKAIEDWERGNEQGILASYYTKIKDYPRAAQSYEKSGNVAKAITCYKKAATTKRQPSFSFPPARKKKPSECSGWQGEPRA